MKEKIIVLDTTLRDGAQDPQVAMSYAVKLQTVPILDNFGIDYIEFGWPVLPEHVDYFKKALKLAKQAKIVAFGSTRRPLNKVEEDNGLQMILETGVDYVVLFGKTWKDHVINQLKTTPEKNLEAITESLRFLKDNGKHVLYDAEHFFDGYKDDPDYALSCLDAAISGGAETVVLCDTNGGCMPSEIKEIIKKVKEYVGDRAEIGIHTHNDSECAVANTISAIEEGITHVQGTIGGIGERAGNANLCSILPNIAYKLGKKLNDKIDLKELKQVNQKVHDVLGVEAANNQPYVGKSSFAHKGGIHIDAIMKGASYSHLRPELVGNLSKICLSNNSGASAILEVVNSYGYPIKDKKDSRVLSMLKDVHNMTNSGYDINVLEAEHFLLTEKHFGNYQDLFNISNCTIISEFNKDSICKIYGIVNGSKKTDLTDIEHGGPVDAIYKAIKKLVGSPKLNDVHLLHYEVKIPKVRYLEEASSVNVYINFKNGNSEWTTVGNDPNILKASTEAIEKGFRYFLLKK